MYKKEILLVPEINPGTITYHVSSIDEFWNTDSAKKYIADPYIANFFNLKNNENFDIASYTRKDKDDYLKDVTYLNSKMNDYLNYFVKNLKEIHKSTLSDQFFYKTLSMGFLRYVHLQYDAYKIFQTFDPSLHTVKVLNQNNYQSFRNFNDYRAHFQNDEFGFEQLFSLYIKCFYPERYESNRIEVQYKARTADREETVIKKTLFEKLQSVTVRKILSKIFQWKQPKVGILHSYFSHDYLKNLIIDSLGKINSLEITFCNRKSNLDYDLRKTFISDFPIKDGFDQFFKFNLNYIFPTFLLEDFQMTKNFYIQQTDKFSRLKYVVSEAWIGHSEIAFFIALLQEKNIKHIYNEHNYMEHFLLGNHIEYMHKFCDIYYSLGWHDNRYKNHVSGGSLFSFKAEKAIAKYKYLHIASMPVLKMAEINCAYGEQEENSVRYFEYLNRFYSNFSEDTMQEVVFRAYPNKSKAFLEYNNIFINQYEQKFRFVDDHRYPSKKMIGSARLIIVDYISTAYIESIISNIPTIILLDLNRYYLNDEYHNFFNDLLSVGICQNDPEQAANFINNLGDDIEMWWESAEVQNAKIKFLSANIGNPKDAIQFYLDLAKEE